MCVLYYGYQQKKKTQDQCVGKFCDQKKKIMEFCAVLCVCVCVQMIP